MNHKTIAMWSGPRNLSTAMMRAFAQRTDCQAWDEPFYAAYLVKSGIEHPMREAIIADGIASYEKVSALCLEKPTPPKTLFYQKHMTHHMIDDVDLSWVDQLENVFLIRSPERVIASYVKKRQSVVPSDLGYDVQRYIFDYVLSKKGSPPIVIDSSDIRKDPKSALEALCMAVGLEFDMAMLSWKSGPAPEDGVWAKHWYDAIWNSTGFAPPEEYGEPGTEEFSAILNDVWRDFDYLQNFKLQF